MAHAHNIVIADGSTTSFLLPFNYLEKEHIKVHVDNVLVTDTTSAYTAGFEDDTTIRVVNEETGAAVESGKKIKISRETPVESALVEFQDGAVIRSKSLNANTDQTLFVAQEIHDRDEARIGKNNAGDFDAGNSKIVNVAPPVGLKDAVNKGYINGYMDSIRTAVDDSGVSSVQASVSAAAAASSANKAQQFASRIEALWDNFDDRYLGAFTAAPAGTVSDPLITGQLYFNTVDKKMMVYGETQWLDITTAPPALISEFIFNAADQQTEFSGDDSLGNALTFVPNNIQVTVNGVRLSNEDFTQADGDTITLTETAEVGDVVQITAFSSFEAVDGVPASAGGTFGNNVSVLGSLTANSIVLGHGWKLYATPKRLVISLNDEPMAAVDDGGHLQIKAITDPVFGFLPIDTDTE